MTQPARAPLSSAVFAALTETTDAPDDNSTPYVMATGDSFSGTLDIPGDRDRVAIEMTEGMTYVLSLEGYTSGAGTLGDPYLRLYDGGGGLVGEDDDGGNGYESALIFTATETGTYYIEAAAYGDGYAGSYVLGAALVLTETTDAPADLSTPYSLNPGDSFTGTIDSEGDRDWIAIELTEGMLYTISMLGAGSGEGTILDSYLRLYDASGTLLASNDDGGADYDSILGYVATASGTYYIEAAGYEDVETGSYVIRTEENVPPAPATLDELAAYLTDGYWADSAESRRAFDTGADTEITVNLTGLTAEGRQLARWALEAWEMVADLDFTEVTGSADITFDDSDSGAYSDSVLSGGEILSSFVNVSTEWIATYGTTPDSYSFQTYIHEIGHALGLGHQGNYNGSATYGVDETFANDSWQVSIMSYFSQDDNSLTEASLAYLVSTMMADILAIQSLYGAAGSGSITAGNTVWGANSTLDGYLGALFRALFDGSAAVDLAGDPIALTIYDAGGHDLLDLSTSDLDQRVDLNDESFSDVLGGIGNLGIARGTIIEDVTTGTGNDEISGNEARNSIDAGAGDDWIDGGANHDFIDGGSGADTLLGGGGNDSLLGREGADSAEGGAGNDNIALHGGADYASGGEGNDSIGGGTGNDTLYGESGNDEIGGGDGDDLVNAGGDRDAVSGGAGNDTVYGGSGDDTLAGGQGLDLIEGGDGDDALGGGYGSDDMSGGAGADNLGGGNGADTLRGEAGDDFLAGGGGRDLLYGGDGDDTLNGGLGDDTLSGGDGSDLFAFNTLTAGETDTILDFEDGIDRIRISGGSFAALDIEDVAGGVQIALSGQVLLLDGVGAADLSAEDFVFV